MVRMHYTVASLLSLAAIASAATIAPRADFGSWAFRGTNGYAQGMTTISVSATYTNSELAAPIVVSCNSGYTFNPDGTASPTASCTDDSFTYDFPAGSQYIRCRHKINDKWANPTIASEVVTLSQIVTLNGQPTTVKGSAVVNFTRSDSGTGFHYSGEGIIPVTSAVA